MHHSLSKAITLLSCLACGYSLYPSFTQAVTTPISITSPHTEADKINQVYDAQNTPRPVWAIAHRVLTKGAVDAALAHKANALEIDVRYESAGTWWAAHDAGALGKGDKLQELFNHIISKTSSGAFVSFVWLDMKTPDGCDNEFGQGRKNMQGCKIQALTDMARNTLEAHGIRVLYAFEPKDAGANRGLRKVVSSLTKKEAITLLAGTTSSNVNAALRVLEAERISPSSAVLDRGLFNPSLDLGQKIISDLHKMVSLREENKIARAFGWTAVYEKHVDAMFDTRADGIIYGNAASQYSDSSSNRDLAKKIRDYVTKNHLRIATAEDIPFGEGRALPAKNSRLKSLKSGECLAMNMYNNPVMKSCDDAAEWVVTTLPSGRFTLKLKSSEGTGFCLTEWNGELKATLKCGAKEAAPYQEWQWEGEYLKNGKYYLNGASLINDLKSLNAYQVRWKLL